MRLRRKVLFSLVAGCLSLGGLISHLRWSVLSGVEASSQGPEPHAPVTAASQTADFHSTVGPLLQGSCVQCHNASALKGDLDLARFVTASDKSAKEDCDILQAVADRVKSGAMPPRGRPRPDAGQVTLASAWIGQACGSGPEPAPEAKGKSVPTISQNPETRTSAAPSPSDAAGSRTSADLFEADIKPMIQTSCGKCHNETKMSGDLDLTHYLTVSGAQALKDRDIWEAVANRVEKLEMPPAGAPRLDAQQIARVPQWVRQEYARMDEDAAPDPGRVTARRLNRHEYNNTVRDLLGVNLNASADFPPDPYAYGFDNVGDALTLSPALTEMYWKAAQRIARAAIPLGPPLQPISTKYDAATLGQRNRLQIQTLHEFPVDAAYSLRMAWDQQMPKGTIVTGHLAVDGREVFQQTFSYDIAQERAVTALKVPVAQGVHKVQVRMELAPAAEQPRPIRGPLPYPISIEIIGPFTPPSLEHTASFRQIFFEGAPRPGAEAAYLHRIVERLALHAYRRPPTKLETGRLLNLTALVHQHGGDFYKQVQVALEAILMSPDFLFRIEKDPVGSVTHRVSEFELASRLSYFLWSSMPDDQLLSIASAGRLHDPDVLHAQVRRMLANPKAFALSQNFTGEWLQTQNLEFEKPDAKTFPEFDVDLRDAMQTETRMFFTSVVQDDRSILDFLNGKYTFLNDRLAGFYGIAGVSGPGFRRVSLEGTDRGGILTQASVLTATSYPTRTSPTVRGKWILTNILNTPPPEPPANVPSLVTSAGDGKPRSIRDRLGMHRANPVCASCHSGMDPLGFALEHYNAIGQWREVDDGLSIDASGQLPDGTSFTGASELQAVLMAQSGKFVNCFTEKLLTYGLGRGLLPSDKPSVRRIERTVAGNGHRFSALVYAIVDSAPFQMRHTQDEAPAALQRITSAANTGFIHSLKGDADE